MLSRAILLCCMVSALSCVSVNGMSLTNCDGLMCPENTFCSVSSNFVNGQQQTVRTCSDMQGNVVAKSSSVNDARFGSQQSSVVHSSNFAMGGGDGSCIQHTSSVNGATTTTYQCNTGSGNSYYVTNTDGVYKNCTLRPVNSDQGVTTEEQCVPMSPEDVQRVKQMEEEVRKNAAEVQQRMSHMANELQAKNQEMQSRLMDNMNSMKENMNNMKQNMQHTFDEGVQRAKETEKKMMQMSESMKQRTMEAAKQAQAQVQQTMAGFENMGKSFQNVFKGIF